LQAKETYFFEKKGIEEMENYIDFGLGNYAILSREDVEVVRENEIDPLQGILEKYPLMVLSLSLELELVLFLKVPRQRCTPMLLGCSLNVQTMKMNMRH
jgi:hypothetical protein